MIKAIFFDFDGVIVDSEKLHTDNTINYFKEANIPLSDSIVYGDIGSNPKLNYWKGVYDEYKDIIPYTYEEFDEGIVNAHKKLKDFRLFDCDLYVTLEPCDMCMNVIKEARIENVYYLIPRNENKKIYSKTNKCIIQEVDNKSLKYRELLTQFFKDNCKR